MAIKLSTYRTSDLDSKLRQARFSPLDVMVAGVTGAGKSTTLNSFFQKTVAKVGGGVDPETMDLDSYALNNFLRLWDTPGLGYGVNPETIAIQKYEMDNLVLWDSPGFGDNPEKDKIYALQIAVALKERDTNGQLLIDGVVVITDGSNRDMKTAYEVIEQIVFPYVGESSRLTIAINQCDMALKGRYWDYDQCKPEPQLVSFLNDKLKSVKNRIYESTGVSANPLYYSALHHYNISKLLSALIRSMPETKRFLIADSLNKSPDIWKANDDLSNYNQEIQTEIKGSLTKALDAASKGAVAGATVGALIPVIGPIIGAAVGAVLGFLGGLTE